MEIISLDFVELTTAAGHPSVHAPETVVHFCLRNVHYKFYSIVCMPAWISWFNTCALAQRERAKKRAGEAIRKRRFWLLSIGFEQWNEQPPETPPTAEWGIIVCCLHVFIVENCKGETAIDRWLCGWPLYAMAITRNGLSLNAKWV